MKKCFRLKKNSKTNLNCIKISIYLIRSFNIKILLNFVNIRDYLK